MKLRTKRIDIEQYLLIYLCMLNTSSKMLKMFQDQIIVFTFLVCTVLMIIGKVKLKNSYFGWIAVLFLWIFVQHVALQGNISILSVANLLSKYLVAYCAVAIRPKKFVECFVKTICFFAGVSLLFYCVSFTPVSSVMKVILITNNDSCWVGNVSYGRLLYHYMPGYTRNVGIFNEPGVYQLFLNVALFFTLFKRNELCLSDRKYSVSIAILVLSVITAASTAGYITMIILIMGYVFSLRKAWGTKKVGVIITILIALGIFIQTDLFNEVFAEKLLLSSDEIFANGTGNARVASILLDLQYIRNNIWGNGYSSSWVNTSTIATFETGSSVGLTSMVNVYGVPISTLIYCLYIWAFKKCSSTNTEFVILLLMFISSFLSQPWILTPVYLVIFSYAFFHNINRSEV
ncbi:MAG: hypothetical protein PHQ72_00540 [Hespellia sp.]|nr:hypothetical protein [Hespellia sp.]